MIRTKSTESLNHIERIEAEQSGSAILATGERSVEEISSEEEREVRRIIQWIRGTTNVRQLVEARLAGKEPDGPDAKLTLPWLFAQTPKRGWRERAAGAWLLGRVELDWKPRYDAVAVLSRVLVEDESFSTAWSLLAGPFFVIFFPLLLVGSISTDIRQNRIREQAARALGRIGQPSAAAALAEVMQHCVGAKSTIGSSRVRLAAEKALPKVLENVGPQHYRNLQPDPIPGLCKVLESWQSELALSVLRALELIGDNRTQQVVRRTARVAASADVKSQAGKTLAAIEARIAKERDAERLLRPAVEPASQDSLLLRPAKGSDCVDLALLRPAEPHQDTTKNVAGA